MPDRCEAKIYVGDDRWGGFIMQCENEPDHEGPHIQSYSGCEPKALLIWEGAYEKQ